jgi:hypothetical protein
LATKANFILLAPLAAIRAADDSQAIISTNLNRGKQLSMLDLRQRQAEVQDGKPKMENASDEVSGLWDIPLDPVLSSYYVFFSCSPFSLELIQYDAMNAFMHAIIDEKNFMKLSSGYQISKTRDDVRAQQSITQSSEIIFNFGRKSCIQHYKP